MYVSVNFWMHCLGDEDGIMCSIRSFPKQISASLRNLALQIIWICINLLDQGALHIFHIWFTLVQGRSPFSRARVFRVPFMDLDFPRGCSI